MCQERANPDRFGQIRPNSAMTKMGEQQNQRKSGERIAKVIARAGIASRREAEAWIAAGRVAVNGAVILSPALDVTPSDRIMVDGAPLPARQRTRLFLYHKLRRLMTTHADPQGRSTIFQNLPPDLPRLISVGRLDFNTEGLLLLTNDGALARVLELPSTGWLRRYRVRAHGGVTQAKLDSLRPGVTISAIHYGPIEATLDRVQGSNVWLTLGIREGKNREVRNVLGHLGLTVTRLIRISFGPFQLGELREGTVEEVPTRVLREQLGEKLVKLSGADFSGPQSNAPSSNAPRSNVPPSNAPSSNAPRSNAPRSNAPRSNAPRSNVQRPSAPRLNADRARGHVDASSVGERQSHRKAKNRNSADHAWRAHDESGPPKKLRRRFHGAQRKAESRPQGEPRAGMVTDRKGRAVSVEHYAKPEAQQAAEDKPHRGNRGTRQRRRDRAPRAPRGRR
jgi:23S rRNA pseudouridine2605 synthase